MLLLVIGQWLGMDRLCIDISTGTITALVCHADACCSQLTMPPWSASSLSMHPSLQG